MRDTCYNVPICVIAFSQVSHVICAWKLYRPLCQGVNDHCPNFSAVVYISYSASGSASESGFGSAFGSGSGLSMSCYELEPDSEERDFFLAWHSITTVAMFTAPLQTAAL